MEKMFRRAVVAAATLLLSVTSPTVLSPANPVRAAVTAYVALGDSYSAGVGTRDARDDCYRSPYGYPALIAGQYGLSLDYQACSGATTADVTSDQVPALSRSTTAVSMTIGGNDAGFTDVITECALPSWASDCARAVDGGLAVVTNDLPGRYDTLFSQIRSKAPKAAVVIGGYPLIFQGEDCNAATFFSPDDESRINSATSSLDDLIRAESATYGFGFVDPRPAFTGHAVCDDPEWINGFSDPVTESYHPNRDGNVGYAGLFGPALTGRPFPTAALQRTAETVPAATWEQQAEGVLAMKLDSPANLARARMHGVDAARIKKLVRMLRTGDQDQIRAALAKLQQLDRRSA